VLFADLVGYTSLSETADPEAVKNLVDSAFERLVSVITSFGGRVDKIVGDGIVALFGAPTAHEDDPERAVRAGLRMQEALAAHAAEAGAEMAMRIGINSGEVLVGALRAGGDYTAMGDTVNLASRLETAAAPGEVLVGPSTWAATRERIAYEERGLQEAKGRDELVDVHAAMHPVLPPGHRTRRLRAPLVGRDAEMAMLGAGIDAAVAHNRAHLLLLYGEAGVGKSRLAEEVAAAARDTHGASVFEGRCVPYGEANVWWPIAGAIRQACDLTADDSEPVAREGITEVMARILEAEPDATEVAGIVNGLLWLLGYEGALRGVDAVRARDEATNAVLSFLEASSRRHPVVVVLSDLHWADDLVLQMIDQVLERLGRQPCVMLATARHTLDERWQPAPGRHNSLLLSLDPLDAKASATLVDNLFEGNAPPGLADLLIARSGGNPFFLEELVALMEENSSGATSDLTSDRVVQLPDTLRGLVSARLDGLTDDERAVLADASVLGRRSAVYGLAEMAKKMRGQDDISAALAGLVAKEILVLEPSGGWYSFRSDLMRDVAYSTITKVDRARAHAGIGKYLTHHAGDDADDANVERIAHHFSTAAGLAREMGGVSGLSDDLDADALAWAVEAADRAARHDLRPNALRWYDAALSLAPAEPSVERTELLLGRGLFRARLNQREAALLDVDAAFAEAESLGDAAGIGHATLVRGQLEEVEGDFAAAVSSYDEAVKRLMAAEDPSGLLAEALRHRGMAELFMGDVDQARSSIAEALDAARAAGDRATEAWALQNLAWIAYDRGRAEEAEVYLHESIELFDAMDDHGGLGWALGLLAWVRFHQGHREEAEALAQKILPETDRRSDRWGQGMMQLLIACARLWSGRAAAVAGPAEEAADLFDEIDDAWGRIQSMAVAARALIATGEIDQGMALVDAALAVRLMDSDQRGNAAVVVGASSAIEIGDPDRAEAILGSWPEDDLDPGAMGDREIGVARGLAALQRGAVSESLRYLGAAAGEGRDAGGPPARAALALAVAADGRVDEVRALAEPVVDAPSGTYLDSTHALLALGLSAAGAGDAGGSAEWFARAHEVVDPTDDQLTAAVVLLAEARALEHTGADRAAAVRAEATRSLDALGIKAEGWTTVFDLVLA
jgi:class 3 adenylate cyclase/tetratricopeptide (TPR) repeat protein